MKGKYPAWGRGGRPLVGEGTLGKSRFRVQGGVPRWIVGFFRVFLGSSWGAGVCVPLINTAERRRGVPVKTGWVLVP